MFFLLAEFVKEARNEVLSHRMELGYNFPFWGISFHTHHMILFCSLLSVQQLIVILNDVKMTQCQPFEIHVSLNSVSLLY